MIDLLMGGIVLLAGVALGWVLGITRQRQRPVSPVPYRPPPPRKTVCGCSHHLALHDPRTMRCHGTVQEPSTWWSGRPLTYKTVTCHCRQYVGPLPMTEFVATDLPIDEVARMRKLPEMGSDDDGGN